MDEYVEMLLGKLPKEDRNEWREYYKSSRYFFGKTFAIQKLKETIHEYEAEAR